MALSPFLPASSSNTRRHRRKKTTPTTPPPAATSSWQQLKSLLSCRSTGVPSQVHDPAAPTTRTIKLGSTCGSSICALRDVVHGNTRVVHRADSGFSSSSSISSRSVTRSLETVPLAGKHHPTSSKAGMQLRKLSGCYECNAVSVEPLSRRYPRPRTLSSCSDCGEVFTKPDSLELHQTLRHAVSELAPEDSGRNIVEIIFKSSWQKKDSPMCVIERILKVHNTQRTIARFEDYREAVKSRVLTHHHLQASSSSSSSSSSSAVDAGRQNKNPRCAADGNELLRFHSTSLLCALGARDSTALCLSAAAAAAPCGACTIIRHGFSRANQIQHPHGVRTTASSGRAHECGPSGAGGRRAMLLCRVIAGRVRHAEGDGEWYDSVAGSDHDVNLEELFVSNPRAILPCFVVVYRVLD